MASGTDSAVGELARAVSESDWEAVFSVLRSSWTSLAQEHPAALLASLEEMPLEVINRAPRLRVAKAELGRTLHGAAYGPRGAGSDPLPTVMTVADRISIQTAHSAAARAEGRLDEALALVSSSLEALATLSASETASLSAILPQILQEWAGTYEQAGRWEEACSLQIESYDWATTIGHLDAMATAAGTAAYLNAVAGRNAVARSWIARLPDVSPRRVPVEAVLAEAILAIDELDSARAARLLSGHPSDDAGRRDGDRQLVRALNAQNDPWAARLIASTASRILRPGFSDSSPGPAALLHAIAALTSVGDPLEATPRPTSLLGDLASATRALTAALAGPGSLSAPRRAVAPLLEDRSAPRVLVTALLATAPRSLTAIREAVSIAHTHSVFSVFTRLPIEQRREVAALLDEHGDSVIAQRLREPGRTRAPLLPAAEYEVALAAAAGATASEIARVRGVSINTVKTQLKHAYRTLGIRSRAELIALLADTEASRPVL